MRLGSFQNKVVISSPQNIKTKKKKIERLKRTFQCHIEIFSLVFFDVVIIQFLIQMRVQLQLYEDDAINKKQCKHIMLWWATAEESLLTREGL